MVAAEQVEKAARSALVMLDRLWSLGRANDWIGAAGWSVDLQEWIKASARLALESGGRVGDLLGLLAVVFKVAYDAGDSGDSRAAVACREIVELVRQEAGREIQNAILLARQQARGAKS